MNDAEREYTGTGSLDRVSVHRTIDALNEELWTFWFRDGVLTLDSYCTLTRASRRHKPRIGVTWTRLDHRDNTIKSGDVPWNRYISEAARNHAARQIVVADFRVGEGSAA